MNRNFEDPISRTQQNPHVYNSVEVNVQIGSKADACDTQYGREKTKQSKSMPLCGCLCGMQLYHDACDDDDDDDDDERWSTSGPGRRFDARLIELRSARVWIVVLA